MRHLTLGIAAVTALAILLAPQAEAKPRPKPSLATSVVTSPQRSLARPPVTLNTPLGPITSLVLDNGLTVILKESHASPVVSFNVTYRVGARNEGLGQTGSAHLLEHMLFKGTRRFGKGQIAQLLGRNGANYNASTWPDYTNYYETYASDRLELGFIVEASRMRDALILDSERQSEMTVVRNEMEGDESDPANGLYQEVTELAFRSHPYHHPTIGYRADVEGVSTEQLRRFYERYYAPNNAVVVLVGDFSLETAIKLAHQHFDGVAPVPAPPPVYTTEEPQMGERRVVMHRRGEVNLLQVAFHIPQAASRDLAPLMVLDALLTTGVTSRLHQALVESDQAGRVWSEVGIQRDTSLFRVGADLKPAHDGKTDHADVEAALWRALDLLRTGLVTPDELAHAKRQTMAADAFANDGAEELAQELGAYAVRDRFQRAYELQAQIAAVTPLDLNRVVKAYFTRDNATTGWFVATADGPIPPAPTNTGGGLARGASAHVQPPPPFPFESGHTRPIRVNTPKRRVLKNGLEVWVLENPGSRTVAFDSFLRVGSANDPKGKAGLAEAVADLLDAGTRSHDKLALARQLEDVGATLETETTPLTTNFAGQCLPDDAPRVLQALAERLQDAQFPNGELERLQDTWKGSLTQGEDDPNTRARRALARAIFPSEHPLFVRTPLEASKQIDAISRQDLVGFHARHYGPNAFVLVVAGNVVADNVFKQAEGAFEGWKPVTLETPKIQPVKLNGPSVEAIDLPGKTETQLFFGHAGNISRMDPRFFAYALANDILGGDTWSSRLGAKLRDEMGVTYGTYSDLDAGAIAGAWDATLSVNPANTQSAIAAMREELARFAASGVTDDELAFAKRSFIGSQAHSLATNTGMARSLVRMALFNLGEDYWVRYADLVAAVTREEVNAAAREMIHPEAMHLVIVGPGASAAMAAPPPGSKP